MIETLCFREASFSARLLCLATQGFPLLTGLPKVSNIVVLPTNEYGITEFLSVGQPVGSFLDVGDIRTVNTVYSGTLLWSGMSRRLVLQRS
jgi:hypothetical protein